MRTFAFSFSVVGAVAAQLLGRRIDGAVVPWALAGALAGATIALVFGGSALVAHGLHVPQWLATAIATDTSYQW